MAATVGQPLRCHGGVGRRTYFRYGASSKRLGCARSSEVIPSVLQPLDSPALIEFSQRLGEKDRLRGESQV